MCLLILPKPYVMPTDCGYVQTILDAYEAWVDFDELIIVVDFLAAAELDSSRPLPGLLLLISTLSSPRVRPLSPLIPHYRRPPPFLISSNR